MGGLRGASPSLRGRVGVGLWALAVLLIPLSATDLPIVRLHGFCAIGVVLLCAEVRLVGGELRQIGFAGLDHLRYRGEAVTDLDLALTQRAVAFVRIGILDVDALAVRVGGRCRSVRHDDVVAVVVTVLFLGFLQGALDVLDSTGADSCFCHSVSALFSLVPYEGLKVNNK